MLFVSPFLLFLFLFYFILFFCLTPYFINFIQFSIDLLYNTFLIEADNGAKRS